MTSNKEYWQGKIALITGGSSGIGLAVGHSLVEQGAQVWLMARGEAQLQSARETFSCEIEHCCRTISADVSEWEQVTTAVAYIEGEAGLLDIVVNSAGVVHPGYFQDLDLEIFHWMMNINYFGTVNVCKAVVPGMIARGSGHIVNISSLAGLVGVFGYTAYGGSKFAVSGFTDTLRAELKPLGIGVSIVYPVDTDTPQLAYENKHKPPETKAIGGTANVMSPEDVAQSILHNVKHGRYIIIPGFDGKLLYWVSRLLGSGVYPVMDWLVRKAQRQNQRGE
jgi:3-dehydrosphinganine reductase